jgi:hypothetical protein
MCNEKNNGGSDVTKVTMGGSNGTKVTMEEQMERKEQ